jgi:hypothetical protein
MDLRLIGCEVVDWNHLIQDKAKRWAVVNTVMNLHVTYNARNFLTI